MLALLLLGRALAAQSPRSAAQDTVRVVGRARSAATDTVRLTLDQAVQLGVRQSDEVGLAAAQTDVADAQLANARANVLPQLRFNGSYTHVYESARGQAVGSLFNQPNTYTFNTNLSQTLFQGGRLVSAVRAGSDLRQAAREDESEQRATVTMQVQRAYLQVLFAARIAELQQGNVTLASNRVTQIEQLQSAGQAARYDVLRARVERANLEPVAIQARSDYELAQLDLKRLLNVRVDQPLVLVSQIDTSAATTLLTAADDTTATPDRATIRSAELNASARHLGVRVARADFWPALSVFFQTVAVVIARRRRLSVENARSALNAVVASAALLAVAAAAAATHVRITGPDLSVDYAFAPVWALLVVALIPVAVVCRVLWRTPAERWPRVEAWTLMIVVAPVFIYLGLAFIRGDHQPPLDFFHDGERVGASHLVLDAGRFPWRDLLFIHGLQVDVVFPGLDMAAIEHSRWGWFTGQALIERPLFWVSTFALCIYLFRRNPPFLVGIVLLLVLGWLDPLDYSRMTLLPPSLLALAALLGRSTWPRAFAFMAVAGAQAILGAGGHRVFGRRLGGGGRLRAGPPPPPGRRGPAHLAQPAKRRRRRGPVGRVRRLPGRQRRARRVRQLLHDVRQWARLVRGVSNPMDRHGISRLGLHTGRRHPHRVGIRGGPRLDGSLADEGRLGGRRGRPRAHSLLLEVSRAARLGPPLRGRHGRRGAGALRRLPRRPGGGRAGKADATLGARLSPGDGGIARRGRRCWRRGPR